MEIYKVEDLSFTYPNQENKVLSNITFSIQNGEFITLCGHSGCGKTTLLRMLKKVLTPYGKQTGRIIFLGKDINIIDECEQTSKIGFVMQNPDNQIVTDKVWHELAFGLESLGIPTEEIRIRVAEMASFFGIQEWFYKNVSELSGGQKQLLNLASIMLMRPEVLILDEPTSQLDPIAAGEFLKTLEKINKELGTTIIISEHRLDEVIPISNRVIVMENGRIIVNDEPRKVMECLKKTNNNMYSAFPVPMRIYSAIDNKDICPLNIREGKIWLENYSKNHILNTDFEDICKEKTYNDEIAIELKNVWFRYEKNLSDVLKGIDLRVKRGELFSIVGGNGTGKTTTLSIISGINTPYRGKVYINGSLVEYTKNLYSGVLGVLPQNPQTLFVKKTVYLDLIDMVKTLPKEEKEKRVMEIATLCKIDNLLDSHPYDLSGGEQQRVALAKVLLTSPQILLLDEPTKGMDAEFKSVFADILYNLKSKGVTIIMVSHDVEFCAEYSDHCALFFDGKIISSGEPRNFFKSNTFYTTATNRMARGILPNAVLTDDLIFACGGKIKKRNNELNFKIKENTYREQKTQDNTKKKNISPSKIILSFVLLIIFTITNIYLLSDKETFVNSFFDNINPLTVQIFTILEIGVVLYLLIPKREIGIECIQQPERKRKLDKRTAIATILILFMIPLTIFIGIVYLQDRKYYFISLLIILETLIPFCMIFENKKPQAREVVLISVLCAIAVAGRMVFYITPQFKPVVALVIISGVCLGGETGFLVGAVTGFVSNFFFGQGPWTPWQMFAFGIIGFLAGILLKKGILRKTKASLCVFGGLATILIYGGIMNPSTIFMMQDKVNLEMILASYVAGFPFDVVHAFSTLIFLWFISEPMIEKIERIKIKYGLIEK